MACGGGGGSAVPLRTALCSLLHRLAVARLPVGQGGQQGLGTDLSTSTWDAVQKVRLARASACPVIAPSWSSFPPLCIGSRTQTLVGVFQGTTQEGETLGTG